MYNVIEQYFFIIIYQITIFYTSNIKMMLNIDWKE